MTKNYYKSYYKKKGLWYKHTFTGHKRYGYDRITFVEVTLI